MENTNYSSFNRLSSNSTQPIIPKEYQSKITLSKILLVNLNATITELAKKLILKGFNIYLYDKGYITEKDITTNFYLNESDLGKERAKTILERLNHLSAVVSISIIEEISIAKDIKFACVGFRNFTELANYEEYFTRKEVIYYCINTSGIYGFYYNNIKVKRNGDVIIDPISFVKKSEAFLSNIKNNILIVNQPIDDNSIDSNIHTIRISIYGIYHTYYNITNTLVTLHQFYIRVPLNTLTFTD